MRDAACSIYVRVSQASAYGQNGFSGPINLLLGLPESEILAFVPFFRVANGTASAERTRLTNCKAAKSASFIRAHVDPIGLDIDGISITVGSTNRHNGFKTWNAIYDHTTPK